jgi:hypothetical protein
VARTKSHVTSRIKPADPRARRRRP